MNLHTVAAAFFQRYHLTGTAGVVALSGGPDSVALAHLLTSLLRGGQFSRLVFAHINHRLRGDESDADESFVRGLHESWQIAGQPSPTLQYVRLDSAEAARESGQNLEACARAGRYTWLTDLARREGAVWVATGHNADDQAETVLFRLLRGSGLAGLAGMHSIRPLAAGIELVRPLLCVTRQDVLDYLATHGLPSRQDSSNLDPRFTRNRLRHELLPLLRQHYNPAIQPVLCRLALQASEVQRAIEREASELLAQAELPRAGETLVFRCEPLEGGSVHLVREMFRLLWQREDWPMGEMGFDEWERLAEVAAGRLKAWDFPARVHARNAGRVLQVCRGGVPLL